MHPAIQRHHCAGVKATKAGQQKSQGVTPMQQTKIQTQRSEAAKRRLGTTGGASRRGREHCLKEKMRSPWREHPNRRRPPVQASQGIQRHQRY